MTRIVLFVVSMALTGLALIARAFPAPPENADPALAPWFQSLKQPGTGVGCCSIADCRPTEWRTNAAGHYEVLISPQNFAPNTTKSEWLEVPPDKVLDRFDNPTGRAIVCWRPSSGIMCFVRGQET